MTKARFITEIAHGGEVDSLDDSAVAFYIRYGFAPLPDNAKHLYLPLITIDKALE